jgi:hypothetical protein
MLDDHPTSPVEIFQEGLIGAPSTEDVNVLMPVEDRGPDYRL